MPHRPVAAGRPARIGEPEAAAHLPGMAKDSGGFVHLHTHTEYSLLDGMGRIGDVVAAAAADGQPALAIPDHGTLAGAWKFAHACKAAGIKPILGCLLAGQEIVTSQGVKPVEEVQTGDLVLTHKGRFRRVLSTMRRPYRGRGYRVHLAGRYGRQLTL